MADTIESTFDPRSLPAWARRSPSVVSFARVNLGFRTEVCNAVHADYRKFLTREALRYVQNEDEIAPYNQPGA